MPVRRARHRIPLMAAIVPEQEAQSKPQSGYAMTQTRLRPSRLAR